MRARVGRGWDEAAALHVERGDQPCKASDLVLIAQLLGCTVEDLLGVSEPVMIGTTQVPRTDALIAGPSAMPEAEAWERFQEAADALADARQAWSRYTHLIEVARRRIADVPGLRERVTAYETKAYDNARDEYEAIEADDRAHAEIPGLGPAPTFRRDLTPAMLAARDALNTYPIPHAPWSQRPPRQAKEGKR